MMCLSNPETVAPRAIMTIKRRLLRGNVATDLPAWQHHPMADFEHLSVTIAPDIAADVRAAVEAGEYDSVSELVGDALRDWVQRRQGGDPKTDDLRHMIRQGMDSGPGLDADEVFARLRTRYSQ
jgi:antitoxin ParD1/3/4